MFKSHPDHDELIAHLLDFMQMPTGFPDLLLPHLPLPFTYHKDTLLYLPGDTAILAHWPVRGHIRSFKSFNKYPDSIEQIIKTIDISLPKKISLPTNSFLRGKALDCFVLIEEGSTLISFSHSSFEQMCAVMPEVYILTNEIIADQTFSLERNMEMCRLPSEEAYKTYLATYGMASESFVHLKHIASFLGFSAETMSRIRTAGGYSDEHLRK